MAEIYVSSAVDFGVGANSRPQNPVQLLTWAESMVKVSPPENIFRQKEGRVTLRVALPGGDYFLKFHRGVGYRELAKNLLHARLPVFGARDEYLAIAALKNAGIATLFLCAYASAGKNPATRRSLVLTEALQDTISLEDYCADWPKEPPAYSLRVALIREVARIAQSMHHAGINHRDFYLCHFHLRRGGIENNTPSCYLIDLHRAQIRGQVPSRMQVKDLAGLYYSAMDIGLTSRDFLRFIHYYTPGGLRVALRENTSLWRRVARRGRKLYLKNGGALSARFV